MRLVDFGLADAIGHSTAASDIVRSERTDTGRDGVLGSVNYMSPEQAMGRPMGERGDLYQAGATLYFALTGFPPYRRETPAAVMRAHIEAPPPVPSAGIPGAVDRAVVTAMNTDENGRYASAPIREGRSATRSPSGWSCALRAYESLNPLVVIFWR